MEQAKAARVEKPIPESALKALVEQVLPAMTLEHANSEKKQLFASGRSEHVKVSDTEEFSYVSVMFWNKGPIAKVDSRTAKFVGSLDAEKDQAKIQSAIAELMRLVK